MTEPAKRAILALEDGSFFEGTSFGAEGEAEGEIVFNTGMTGYQEILTDPSYAGQIVAMTYPLIGNYGINSEDNESKRPFLRGFVVREAAKRYSNWRADGSLDDFLKMHGVVGIQEIDTRALTKRIRQKGAMKAIIASGDVDPGVLIERAKETAGMIGRDLVETVTADDIYQGHQGVARYRVVAYDFGIKTNILRMLAAHGFDVTVVPARTSAGDVLKQKPDGVFLSNGPGDPAAVTYAVKAVGDLLGNVPVFGICLGHQLLALAMGATTYKLKFGHHGCNHPVMNLSTGKVEITAQNHGFAVDAQTIPETAEITHLNLNDGTIEGIRCPSMAAYSVQYHPEAAPGPHDSRYLFNDFLKMMSRFREKK